MPPRSTAAPASATSAVGAGSRVSTRHEALWKTCATVGVNRAVLMQKISRRVPTSQTPRARGGDHKRCEESVASAFFILSRSMASPPPRVPPLRYSMVEEGVYRGAYPSQINLRFLSRLGLRSMVSLLPEQPAPHLITWCEEHGVRNHAERVASFREEVSLTQERIAELLQLLVLPERQPVYVHCLDGVSVTGTLIMCLRKLQRWAPSPYFAEYARIARDGNDNPSPPAPHVLAFVNAFKPELELARLLPPQLPTWLAAALGGASMAEGVAVDAPHLPPHKEGGLTAGGARGVDVQAGRRRARA